MRIIITGGCGYIGSALAVHLQAAGHDVMTLDRVGPADFPVDYREFGAMDYAKFDAIIHLAGHSSVAACAAEPLQAVQNNLTSFIKWTRKLHGQKLLWASSSSVLSTASRNIYDATKRAAEAIIPEIYPNSYALRFGTVCGVSPKMRWDLMLNKMAASAYTDGIVRVSNPQVHRPILAMRDLCAAVNMLVDHEAPGSVWHLATGNSTVGALARATANHFKAEIVQDAPSPTYDFHMYPTEWPDTFPKESIASILQDLDAQMGHRA